VPDPTPESPQIPVRPVLISLFAGAVLIGVCMTGLMAWYAWKAWALVAPAARLSPAPQLDTALQRIPQKEPPHTRSPSAAIDAAMARVVARGAAAYDPPEGR
jgi:hypothetical protein